MAAAKSMPGAWSGAFSGWPAICANMGFATVEATAYKLPCASWYNAAVNVWSSALDSPKAKASWFASAMCAAGGGYCGFLNMGGGHSITPLRDAI